MLVDLLQVLVQALSFLLVVGLGLTGLLLIPWKEEELAATESAVRTGLRIARHAPEAWLRSVPRAGLRRSPAPLEVMVVRSTQP